MPRQETCRDAVCAFEAYPTARPAAIARAMRCPVRGHVGSDCAEPSQACQVGRPATTTRPCVLCVTVASVSKVERKPPRTIQRVATDGFNKWHQSSRAVRVPTFTTKSARNGHADCVAQCLLSGGKADMTATPLWRKCHKQKYEVYFGGYVKPANLKEHRIDRR